MVSVPAFRLHVPGSYLGPGPSHSVIEGAEDHTVLVYIKYFFKPGPGGLYKNEHLEVSPLYRLASLRFILRLSSSQFARSWLRTVPGGVGRSPGGDGRSPRWWRMVPGGGGRSPVVEDGPQWWMTVPGGGGRSLWWRTVYGGGGWFPARWWRTVPSGRGRSPVVEDGYRWFDLFKKSEVKIL